MPRPRLPRRSSRSGDSESRGRATEGDSSRASEQTTEDPSPVIDSADALIRAASGDANPSDGLSPSRVLALQRTVGNHAVNSVMRDLLQRVPVTGPAISETLYNTSNAGTGQASANSYSLNTAYDMSRSGDTGVTVTVKIKFLSQSRNSVDPNAPGSPPGTPALGTLLGSPSEIPAGDARRDWAKGVVEGGVTHWNGRLNFVGEEWNLLSENTKKRLPVTFKAEPVFDIGADAHSQIIVHPAATRADPATGNPIDAGNYYMNQGDYPDNPNVIAAHEYGHLLGIPDEYSQSNEQINALIHQAAPDTAPSARAALDKKTVERMVLSSMSNPLYGQLSTAMPAVTTAIRAKRPLVKARMAAAARTGVVAPEITSELESQLTADSEASVDANVPRVVAFQTTTNFSNVTMAGEGVEAGFSATSLSAQILDAYWQALQGALSATVNVQGLGDVSINVQGSVGATTAAGGAQAAPAAALATTTVGTGVPAPAPAGGGGAGGGGGPGGAGGGGAAPGLPAITPPPDLVGKISALPSTWETAGSALEAGVTSDVFSAKMLATLRSAAAAATAAAAALPPGAPAPKQISGHRELYQKAHAKVTNAAKEASRQVAAELVATTVNPTLTTSVADLQSSIGTEVERVMGTPPTGVPALGTPDPNMTALVNAMKARLDADKAATAGGGRDPLQGGTGTAADQDVTYSYQGMMGSNAARTLRADQFSPMVAQFNDKLTTTFEKDFTAEVK